MTILCHFLSARSSSERTAHTPGGVALRSACSVVDGWPTQQWLVTGACRRLMWGTVPAFTWTNWGKPMHWVFLSQFMNPECWPLDRFLRFRTDSIVRNWAARSCCGSVFSSGMWRGSVGWLCSMHLVLTMLPVMLHVRKGNRKVQRASRRTGSRTAREMG